jgi:pimeloyl-ACP methyl ester carboxylesterase/DNA-binding CsgD family transcriptional regulator
VAQIMHARAKPGASGSKMIDILRIIFDIVGCEVSIEDLGERPGDVTATYASSEKLAATNWRPQVGLRQGAGAQGRVVPFPAPIPVCSPSTTHLRQLRMTRTPMTTDEQPTRPAVPPGAPAPPPSSVVTRAAALIRSRTAVASRFAATHNSAVNAPIIQYTTTKDAVRIAYYAMGSGIPFVATSELQWSHLGNTFGFRESHRSASQTGIGRGMRVVRYDARGTGLSDQDTVDFSLEAQTQDLEAVLAALAIDRCVLFGHTHGSPLAIAYAAEHPERVSHLVLSLPHARGRDLRPISENLGVRLLPDTTPTQWEQYTLAMASATVGFTRPDIARAFAKSYRESMTPASYRAFLQWREQVDVSAHLARIQAPTLVLSRRAGTRPPTELEVAAGIPGCLLITNDAAVPPGRWLDAETAAIEEFLGIGPAEAIGTGGGGDGSPPSPLTTREREILGLLVAGQSNRKIADRLVLSERTVARHIANIYEKTGVHGRAEVTAYALRHRLA